MAQPRPLPGKPGLAFGGQAIGTTGAAFASEDERRGYLRRVLEEAARAVAEAQAALDAPLAGRMGPLGLQPPADAVEAIQDRQAAGQAAQGRKGA